MGLQPSEVRFFFEEKVTKIDLAYYPVIENHSKVDQRLSMMCLTISLITADNSYLPNLLRRPFNTSRQHSSGSEAPPKGSTLVSLISGGGGGE